MSAERRFAQVDVFCAGTLSGNPLAVVLDSDGLDAGQMQRFAAWTNLSEASFVTAPGSPDADYAVRIFTGDRELPFAGHPMLGTAHAWLAAGGPRGRVLHAECGSCLVAIRGTESGDLSFAAPPRRRTGPLDGADVAVIAEGLGLRGSEIADHHWCDNGSPWRAVLLRSAARVLSLRPDPQVLAGWHVGVVGPHAPGAETQLEVRAFHPTAAGVGEDPVTGSLNAGLAQWLIGVGSVPTHYRVTQGTCLGRCGRVGIDLVDDAVWVGGHCVTVMRGAVML